MPKYAASNMTTEALEWWMSFIDHVEKSIDMPAASSVLTTWNFKELVEVVRDSRAASTAASMTEQTQQCELTDCRAVNDRMLQLRSAETNPIPEVLRVSPIVGESSKPVGTGIILCNLSKTETGPPIIINNAKQDNIICS